jgi:hypothetical protein
MKTKLTSLLLALTAIPMFAGEAKPQLAPGAPALTVEQRFQEADITLALEQYKKLQTAAFEIRLRLQVEPSGDDKQRDQMEKKAAELSQHAMEIRERTIKRTAMLAAEGR